MAKGFGKIGRAALILGGFLGAGFFAGALTRFLGWDAEQSGWKRGGVTLGASLLAYLGLKAAKFGTAANMVLIGGLVGAGVELAGRPVTSMGAKLGDWLRGNAGMSAASAPSGAQTSSASYGGGQQAYSGPTIDPRTVTPTGPAAPSSATGAQAPTTVIYQAPKDSTNPWASVLGEIVKGGAQVASAFVGSRGDDAFGALVR